jgi:hypothetical protein
VCTARDDILTAVPLALAPTDVWAIGVAAGDFNGDGMLDVALTVAGAGLYDYSADRLEIFFGDGGGGFPSSTTILAPPGVFWTDLATGDFNGDGRADLAIGTITDGGPPAVGYPPNSYLLGVGFTVLYGEPDGGFTSSPTIWQASVGIGPYPDFYGTPAISVADFNGDGFSDLAIVNADVSIFYASPDGGFGAPSTLPIGAWSIAVGDVNGDGEADLVVSHPGGSVPGRIDSVMSVYLQHQGQLQLAGTTNEGDFGNLVVGTDGRIDEFSQNGDINVVLFGDAGLALVADLPSQGFYTGIGADLNQDGISDLSGGIYAGFGVFLGHEGGNYLGAPGSQATYSGTGSGALASGDFNDFNGDGRPDLVWANFQYPTVWLNTCVP